MDTKSSKDKPKTSNVVPIRPEKEKELKEFLETHKGNFQEQMKAMEEVRQVEEQERAYDVTIKVLMRMNETLEKIWQHLKNQK